VTSRSSTFWHTFSEKERSPLSRLGPDDEGVGASEGISFSPAPGDHGTSDDPREEKKSQGDVTDAKNRVRETLRHRIVPADESVVSGGCVRRAGAKTGRPGATISGAGAQKFEVQLK
jgi:hypothetical protein